MLEHTQVPDAAPAVPPEHFPETARARILIAAYACRPGYGSEPGIGWNRVIEAAREFEVWVLCRQSTCAAAINAHLQRHGPIAGLHFVFVPESRWERWAERLPGMLYPIYNLWQRRALRAARRLHQRLRFELVHQLTYIGFREPGYLWKLDARFVWGPVGGAQNYPWRFLLTDGPGVALREVIRSVCNLVQLYASLRVRRAASRAELLLAASTTNQRALADALSVESVLFPDTGVGRAAPAPRVASSGQPLRILWCGVLEPRKALHLLLLALARLDPSVAWQLHVVGDGPQRGRWQRLAQSLGIADRIRWCGAIPHAESLAQFDWADVFAFTSLRDTSGTVAYEALAAGLPVICLDHQGVGDLVDPSCGIKVAVTSPRRVVQQLVEAIERLADQPGLRDQLSQGALQRVAPYLWDQQGRRMLEHYRRIIAVDRPPSKHGRTVGDHRQATPGNDVAAAGEPAGQAESSGGQASGFPLGGDARTLAQRSMGWLAARINQFWGRSAKAGVVALADQLVVSGVRFLTTLLIGRVCGAGPLGSYTLAFSLMLAMLAVQDSVILGPFVILRNRIQEAGRRTYLGSVLLGAVGVALIALVLFVIAALLATLSGGVALGGAVGALGVALPFILLHQLARRFAFADLDLRTALLVDVAAATVQVSGLGVLVWAGALSVPAAYGLIGLSCTLPAALWLWRRRRGFQFRWASVPADLHQNWLLGRWILASQLTSVVGVYAAGWILALRLDMTATGIYAACASIVCLTNPTILGLNNVLLPRAAMAYAEGGPSELRRVSRKVMGLLALVMGAATAVLIVLGGPILAVAYGAEFATHGGVIGILAVATLISAGGMAAEQGLLALQRSDIGFTAQLCGVGTTVAISFPLIAAFGVGGAAWAVLLGGAVTATILMAAHEWLTDPSRLEALKV